jgi:pyruvate ferredoxin oxidoreductase delta subunit
VSKDTNKIGWKDFPLAGYILKPGTSMEYKTGDWRAFKPIIDDKKCTGCLFCWIYCPDSAIKRKNKTVAVNYDYCKGCGICAKECPVQAIRMVEES